MDIHGTVEGSTSVRNGVKRMVFVVLSILLEVGLILMLVFHFSEYATWITILIRIFGMALVVLIYGEHKTASIKMPWIMMIMATPILGVALYLLIGLNGSTWRMRRRYEEIDRRLLPELKADPGTEKSLQDTDLTGANLSTYLKNHAGYPLYRNTEVTYYPEASEGLEAQLEDLSRAKKFIFMALSYFLKFLQSVIHPFK